jgi:hypothetical protein
MKTKSLLLCIIGAVVCLAVTPAAFAQTANGSMLLNPTVNLSTGTQNGHVGQAGGVFLTTYSYWPYVDWLGYYDKDGDGLANSHQVALWRVGGTGGSGSAPDALVTIPAGTAAPLYNGYRWVQLPSTLGLWYGTWYTLSAQTDGVDTWGDMISGGQAGWSTQYVDTTAGNEWQRAGRYDTSASWPNSPANQVGSDAIYPVVNMGYNLPIVVPEPGSIALLTLGALAVFARRARRG